MDAAEPTDRELIEALRHVSGLLGREVAWHLHGRFHFVLWGDWSIAISPESAGRIAIEPCLGGEPSGRLLSRVDDRARLASVVEALTDKIRVPV